tara:strand:+ start:3992 stop:4447 length:456 start_codon:yes stop_codon:yes gene_type:complete
MRSIEGGVHVIVSLLVLAWAGTTTRNFFGYWHRHHLEYASANALLRSEVCTDPDTRLSVGHFDQCANAQAAISLRPFHRAVFSVAEDMYICGHRRCELLWLDITERLTLILTLMFFMTCLVVFKWFRLAQQRAVYAEASHWQLPIQKIKNG